MFIPGFCPYVQMTYIFPGLVVELVEDSLLIGNVVVPENSLNFWTHRSQVLNAQKVKRGR